MSSSDNSFDIAVKYVQDKGLVQHFPLNLNNEEKLLFYGLYKQAKQGDCQTPRPGMFALQESYKWDAWKKNAGKTQEQAKQEYVDLFYSISTKIDRTALSEKGKEILNAIERDLAPKQTGSIEETEVGEDKSQDPETTNEDENPESHNSRSGTVDDGTGVGALEEKDLRHGEKKRKNSTSSNTSQSNYKKYHEALDQVEKQLKILVESKKGQSANPLLKKLQSIIEELEKRSRQKEEAWKVKEEKWKTDHTKLQLAYNTLMQRATHGTPVPRNKAIPPIGGTDSLGVKREVPVSFLTFGTGVCVGLATAYAVYRFYLQYGDKIPKK